MDSQQLNALLSTAGITSSEGGINWANIIGNLIFSSIGLCAFMYGKKERSTKPLAIGIVLMVYPYFISNVFAMYGIGIILTVLLLLWKD